jgi:hypothetical protein
MDDDALILRIGAKGSGDKAVRQDQERGGPTSQSRADHDPEKWVRFSDEIMVHQIQGSERVSGAGASGELDCKSRDRPKQGRRGFLHYAW